MYYVSRTLTLLFAALILALILHVPTSAQAVWVEVAPLPTPRAFPAVAVLNGQIFVIGGRDANGEPLDVVERYDPGSNTWSVVEAIDEARFNASATVFNGQILLTGGCEGDDELTDDVEIYDPIDERWESFDHLQDEREGHGTFSVDGDVYVFGGLNEAVQFRDDADVFDEGTDSWEDYGFWTLDTPRAAFAAVSDGSGVLIFGGFGTFGPVAEVEHYVPDQSGSPRAALPEPRGSLAGSKGAGLVFAIGGRNAAEDVVARVDAYNAILDQWEPWPALPEPREGAVAAEVGETLYVFGGQTDSGDLSATALSLDLVTANEPAIPETGFTVDLTGPNPFYRSTTFVMTTDRPMSLTLAVYDVLGRRVALLYHGQVPAGRRVFTWDGSDEAGRTLASGIYLIRATDGQQTDVRRITLLR